MTTFVTKHMTFRELVIAVKDENLPVEMLEQYRDKIVQVVADMQMELYSSKERSTIHGSKE